VKIGVKKLRQEPKSLKIKGKKCDPHNRWTFYDPGCLQT
jgi:hypothetical protein